MLRMGETSTMRKKAARYYCCVRVRKLSCNSSYSSSSVNKIITRTNESRKVTGSRLSRWPVAAVYTLASVVTGTLPL